MAASGSTEQEPQIEVGKIYLVRGKHMYNWNYQEVYVEKITEYAYKFRKECSDGTWYLEWVDKCEFSENHNIIEYLETPINPPYIGAENIKIEINNPEYLKTLITSCPVCGGTGRVPADSVTSGDKVCPNCWGSGHIMKYP